MKKQYLGIIAMLVTLSALVAGPVQATEVSYKFAKGLKVTSDDGDNELNISGRVQARHTYNLITDGGADSNTFEIRRAKLKLDGHVLDPSFKYEWQIAGQSRAIGAGNNGFMTLEDAALDWIPFDYFGIKVGQFKVPFLKQELTSSGKQQFVDRSLSTGDFNFSRDIGLDFHGKLGAISLGYDVFVMNGAGANNLNGNQDVLLGTRFEVPFMGKYDSSEADVDHSESPNFGFGLAYAYNQFDAADSSGTIVAGTKASLGTLDLGFKYQGWSAQAAAMIARTHSGGSFTNYGYNLQLGYFLVPKTFEVALRGAGTRWGSGVARAHEYEYALALNYFIMGHNLKLQTDVAYLLNNGGVQNQDDFRIRSQMQFVF